MSLKISTTPSEEESTIRALLSANLFRVFDERDASKRAAAVQDTYTEDIIWYGPDGIIRGRAALNARASELQTQSPGFKFRADGIMSVSQNLGVLRWYFGPEDKPELVRGTDVIIVEGGKVRALWTTIDNALEEL
jgi:SnoaL-like domain